MEQEREKERERLGKGVMDGEKRRLTREKRRKRGRLCGKDMNIERGI
jgi:hypothetical protein